MLLVWPDGTMWAIEVKRSLTSRVERGFRQACEDLQPERRFVVYPGIERYRIAEGTEAVALSELSGLLNLS